MGATQKAGKRPQKASSNGGISTTKAPPEQGQGAGLWKLFPVLTVLVGIVAGSLINQLAADGAIGGGKAGASKEDALGARSKSGAAAVKPKAKEPLSRSLHSVDVDGPGCGAHAYLSPTHKVHGFHLACVEQQPAGGAVSVMLFPHGQGAGNHTLTVQVAGEEEGGIEGAREVLFAELAETLNLDEPGSDPPNKFPWAMFTPDGQRRITSLKDAITSRLVFIFKGGNFIWPGVEVGHVQTVYGLETLGSIDMKTLSMEPLVFEAKNFLLDEECQHIRTKAEPHMSPSPVSLMDHDKGKPDTNWRTSTTYFMPSTKDPLLQGIDRRVEEFTRVPKSHQEQVQVLKYDKGQRYTAHHDFFNPKMYQKDERTMRNMDGGRKNRMVTVFWYLSDVEEGGETIFPRYGGRTGRVDFSDCTKGLKVKPVEGKVAMFYSLRPDGQFDDFSLHGACPVITGQKWAANKWVWSAPVHK
eukprot:g5381.t1